jgi:Glycosyltransferase family 28 C-terminal domain
VALASLGALGHDGVIFVMPSWPSLRSVRSVMTLGVYDVAILSDLRCPGRTSANIAAEVRAQAAAGMSTVLIHVASPHLKRPRSFQADIAECLREGLADLADDGAPLPARLLVVRQPRIFTQDLTTVPPVHADRTVMVVNQPPGDAGEPERHYRFADVRSRVERYFGPDTEWAPISAPVREQIRRVAPEQPLAEDWHEIIDVGPAAHVARIGVAPSGTSRTVPAPAGPVSERRRALFLTEDLDRTLAIVPHLPADIQAVVATGLECLAEAHAAGLLTEYVPSHEALGVSPARWADFLRRRVGHLVALHRPAAVVVDGLPHDGILAATADHPDTRWLWIREAMWRRNAGTEWIGRGAAFDAILEPGEFAANGDEGLTVHDRAAVTAVAPITRARPAADLAVAAADYMTYHELLAARVPTVFIPDQRSTLHDQLARARFAAAAGAALVVDDPVRLDDVLAQAARPEVRAGLARRCAEVAFRNGAADAATWIVDWAIR